MLEGWEPYRVRPAEHYDSPQRWETGTQHHEAMAGLVAAVDYLAEVGAVGSRSGEQTAGAPRRAAIVAAFDAIGAHERALARRFLEGLAASRGYACTASERSSDWTNARRRSRSCGRPASSETAKALAERGIFVWDGHYYAIELSDRLGLLDTGGAVRIGFCHYHSGDEVDRVLETLAELA